MLLSVKSAIKNGITWLQKHYSYLQKYKQVDQLTLYMQIQKIKKEEMNWEKYVKYYERLLPSLITNHVNYFSGLD